MPVMVMMLVVVVRTRAGDRWNGNCGENGDNQQVAHLNAPGFRRSLRLIANPFDDWA